ncbi:hypothetical protein KDM87_13985 [Undibacterium sp. FT147W]|uniref:Uncharacterized protein n=1 Tax=Undibacterium rivi TaxID=2828729 RepID=A0ABS5H6E6_9BURK|nr:hypothetical protein [Undibacterium rivi]MBR7793704.1 hypothetical protein [Undibacterium rivi]
MSLLTDILIAHPSEAEAISQDLAHHKAWPCLQLKGLDNIKLSALLSALDAEEPAQKLEGEELLVFNPDPEGPWVFALPEQLKDLLSRLPEADVPAVAERWASHEELKFEGWSGSDIQPVVSMLAEFALRAKAESKPLLLWMCL